jgi:hypothetical protein
MYENADYVIVGHYGDFKSTRNISRNSTNPLEEALDSYIEGHIYDFFVDSIFKGTIDADSITVCLTYSLDKTFELNNNITINEYGEVVIPETGLERFDITIPYKFFIEPMPGETVILFLRYDEPSNLFSPLFEPHMIAIDNSGIAQVKTNFLLPDDMREKLTTVEFTNENGKSLVYRQSDLYDPFIDTISGKTLDEILMILNSKE